MSSKIFKGRVSIIKNTKGEIALKCDDEGSFDASNATECHLKMQELSKKHKAPIHKWSLYVADGGTEPVLLTDSWGKPRMTLLAPLADGGTKRGTVTKLA